MTQNNPYGNYYLNQQQGHGMFVFRGSLWQIGHGQVGFGLGGLFRSVARAVLPMIKRGANALSNIALNSGASFVGDVLAGKNAKEAAKACIGEVADVVKKKVIQRVNTYAETGNGKHGAKQAGNSAKKRKASQPAGRNNQAKKWKTSLKTYLVKHEFCTLQITRMQQKQTKSIFCALWITSQCPVYRMVVQSHSYLRVLKIMSIYLKRFLL